MNKQIVILGAGQAGYLSALWANYKMPNVDVTVIKNEKKGIIGVGEATTPNVLQFLVNLGIPIFDFINKTKSTAKNSIKFENFNGNNDYYYHSFSPTKFYKDHNIPKVFSDGCYDQYLKLAFKKYPNDYIDVGDLLSEKNKTNFNSFAYALHFDNNLVNDYLFKLCLQRGIKVIDDEFESCNTDEKGYLTSLDFKNNKDIKCDFVFDCSGFAKLLLGKFYKVNFKSYNDTLAMKSSIIIPRDYKKDEKIFPYTRAIAMKYGWIFEIPLQHRVGRGYIFDSNYINADQAKEEVENTFNEKVDVKKQINFQAGRLEKMWYKNCIGIGLSSNFIEPLESTSLFTTCAMLDELNFLRHHLFKKDESIFVRDHYNYLFGKSIDHIRDFIYFHYIGKRKDTNFWKNFQKDYKMPDIVKNVVTHLNTGNMEYHHLDRDSLLTFSLYGWLKVGRGVKVFDFEKLDSYGIEDINTIVDETIEKINDYVDNSPTHEDALEWIRNEF